MITQSAIFNKTGYDGYDGLTAFLPNFPKVILPFPVREFYCFCRHTRHTCKAKGR